MGGIVVAMFMSVVTSTMVRRCRKPRARGSAAISMEIVVHRHCESLPSRSGNSYH